MSTPPFNISDEMIEVFDAGYESCACPAPRTRHCCLRAGLGAVAPLIAVQVLHRGAGYLDVHGMHAAASMLRSLARDPSDFAAYIAEVPDEAAESGRERSPEPEPKRSCPRCGSPRWVSISLDEGYTRLAQCVPCGAMHPGVIGPGWRTEEYQRAAQRRERSEPSKDSSKINPDGRRSLTEDTP